MASERQIRANRTNAAKSTGPRTIDGKAASAGNAVRHGLTAHRVVLDWEDPTEFEKLRRTLHDEFDPVTPTGFELVEHLAGLLWRLRRSHAYEAALIAWVTHRQAETHDTGGMMLGPVYLSADRWGLRASGGDATHAGEQMRSGRMLEATIGQKDLLNRLGRYEAHLQKRIEKTLERLNKRR